MIPRIIPWSGHAQAVVQKILRPFFWRQFDGFFTGKPGGGTDIPHTIAHELGHFLHLPPDLQLLCKKPGLAEEVFDTLESERQARATNYLLDGVCLQYSPWALDPPAIGGPLIPEAQSILEQARSPQTQEVVRQVCLVLAKAGVEGFG